MDQEAQLVKLVPQETLDPQDQWEKVDLVVAMVKVASPENVEATVNPVLEDQEETKDQEDPQE